nr:cell wall integrity and stress response component 4 [Quercus suber]
MKHHDTLPFRTALAVASFAIGVRGVAQDYCSEQNTGADYVAVNNIYNSHLACSEQCQGQYAFAVMQHLNCWCSNYIPSSQTSIDSCSQSCPGYPAEHCGNEKQNLFGYLALSIAPSGTAGAGSTSSGTTSASEASTSSESVSIFFLGIGIRVISAVLHFLVAFSRLFPPSPPQTRLPSRHRPHLHAVLSHRESSQHVDDKRFASPHELGDFRLCEGCDHSFSFFCSFMIEFPMLLQQTSVTRQGTCVAASCTRTSLRRTC